MGSMALATNSTGANNTAIGKDALRYSTTGDLNVGVGRGALLSNTTGVYNTAVGAYAGDANTTANNNTSLGYATLSTACGNQNTALGSQSLYNNTGSNNTTAGYAALYANTTGSSNTAIGANALDSNTTASNNTAVGKNTGVSVTTGGNNNFLGYLAGGDVTTGANNIMIGNEAGHFTTPTTTGSQNVIVGNFSHANAAGGHYQIVMGYNVSGTGNDTFTFGRTTTDTTCSMGGTTWSAPSDIRLKEDIQDEEVGLDFINELRPVTFQWKKGKDVPEDMKAHVPDSEERVMNGKHNHGFIAQEVKEVIDRYDLKDGFEMWSEDDTDGRQRIGESANNKPK